MILNNRTFLYFKSFALLRFIILFGFSVTCSFLSSAQNQITNDSIYILKIKLYDNKHLTPIKEAFISNLNSKKSAWSNEEGYFSISAKKNHLIRITNLPYKTELLQVTYILSLNQTGDTLFLPLKEKVYDIKQVDIYPFSKNSFKHQFIYKDIPPDKIDSLKKKIQASEDDLYVLQPYLSIPLNLKSKKEKQLIALEKYKRWQKKHNQFYLLAKNISNMKREELNAFLLFCDFSSCYIQVNSLFVLARKLREKLQVYLYFRNMSRNVIPRSYYKGICYLDCIKF